jgi:hypothetical protein
MSEKYLQEIEEILREAEVAPPSDDGETGPPPPRASGRYVLRPPRLGPTRGFPLIPVSKAIMAAMAILLLALVVGAAFGAKALFVGFVVGLLLLAYLMFFARPSGPKMQKRWRGRLVEEEPDGLWSRFNRWLKG